MGWGIWKKLKQGINKLANFGKKSVKKGIDIATKALDVADKVLPVLDTAGIDTGRLKIAKNIAEKVVDHVSNGQGISFNGKQWFPKLLN